MEIRDTVVARPSGPLAAADAGRLCADVRAPASAQQPIVVDLAGPADLAMVEALARLSLLARRRGARLTVRGHGPDLPALLALTGLADVVPLDQPVGPVD